MENLIEIKTEFNTLDKLKEFLESESTYKCSKEYDTWEQRVNIQGKMEQCILLKKNNMHAIKIFFANSNTVKINYIIPNKVMHAYFGKSVKARRNIVEIVTGLIKNALLAPSQKKAFNELEAVVKKVAA